MTSKQPLQIKLTIDLKTQDIMKRDKNHTSLKGNNDYWEDSTNFNFNTHPISAGAR